MEGFCRACLAKYEQSRDLIHYSEQNRRLYVYSTGIQVKRNDAFPFQLCKDCLMKMKIACKFKKLSRTSDRCIKNYHTLKEAGDSVDFGSFIKNNSDSLAFRFSLPSGNSTPAHNRSKDDDDSTCTSIRNFMTDILQSHDIPDTEAQIIRQVIEEEADVLDDSLDSHWLQDDASIDNDTRLDFSFSPFSTPRHVFNDHCYTPRNDENARASMQLYDIKKLLDIPTQPESPLASSEKNEPEDDLKEPENEGESEDKGLEIPRFYVESNEAVNELEDTVNQLDSSRCVINRNLDRALKDEETDQFCLDDLLATPPRESAVSTPTIHNIIFGDNDSNQHLDNYIEKYDEPDVEVDILEDFYRDADPLNIDHDIKESTKLVGDPRNVTDKYDLNNFSCKLCDNKGFKNLRGLTTHFYKLHNESIKHYTKHIKKKSANKPVMCHVCAKNFHNRPNLLRHIKSAHGPDVEHKCDRCGQIFKFESKLRMHMRTHGVVPAKTPVKTHCCNVCGAAFCSGKSLNLHIKVVHEKSVRVYCNECSKGFQRKADLVVHLRKHSGERPYPCLYCHKYFARRDVLTRHIKCHLDEGSFKCCYCQKKYKNAFALKKHIEISETCMRFRLERKLKETENHTLQKTRKNRYFVVRPKPLASLQYPTNGSKNLENNIDAEKVVTELLMEIGYQSPSAPSNENIHSTDYNIQDLFTPTSSPQNGDHVQDIATLKNGDVQGIATRENGDVQNLATSQNGNILDSVTSQNRDVQELATQRNENVQDLSIRQNGDEQVLANPQDGIDLLELISPALLSLPLII